MKEEKSFVDLCGAIRTLERIVERMVEQSSGRGEKKKLVGAKKKFTK